MKKPRIIIIDDHKIFGEGFCSLLESNNFRVTRVFDNSKLALNYIKNRNKIDIVFSDINMPNINGIELVKEIKKTDKTIKVIMMSMYIDKNIINKAYKNGADNYLSKNCSIQDIKAAIINSKTKINKSNNLIENTSLNNDSFTLKYKLTEREKEIIKLILEQRSNTEIANLLEISKRTVETHRKNIMLKLEVKNSIGIAVKAMKHKII